MLASFAHQRVVDQRDRGSGNGQFGEDIAQRDTPKVLQVQTLLLEQTIGS